MSTSRIARRPISIPSGVEVKIKDAILSAKGPKGNLSINLHPYVKVSHEDNQLNIRLNTETDGKITGANRKVFRAIAGTIRANINNIITGVSRGYERKLVLVGVGYRAQAKGKVLALSLGFSHPTDFNVPEGVTIETPTQTEILVKGANKELVGLVAAKIRSTRGPEPYKGKGIRYANEVIELKETKKK